MGKEILDTDGLPKLKVSNFVQATFSISVILPEICMEMGELMASHLVTRVTQAVESWKADVVAASTKKLLEVAK